MRWALFIWLWFSCAMLFAQGEFELAFQPELNITHKLSPDWKLNLNIQSRQLLRQGAWRAPEPFRYDYLQTDVSLVASRKLGFNNLAVGYMGRFRGDQYLHRLIQQYTLSRQLSGLRLAHRFASDQTFGQDESLNLRLRYRFAVELPLSGREVDPLEFYLKINNEYLLGFEQSETSPEIRLVPLLGFLFNDNNKLEGGLDYRWRDFSLSRFFVGMKWYVVLGP